MHFIHNIPFKELQVNDAVASHLGQQGEISQLIQLAETQEQVDDEIVISWVDGTISRYKHHNCDCVMKRIVV
jgi:hypothetical protein